MPQRNMRGIGRGRDACTHVGQLGDDLRLWPGKRSSIMAASTWIGGSLDDEAVLALGSDLLVTGIGGGVKRHSFNFCMGCV